MGRIPAERVGEAMRRSLPYLPGEARATVEAMLSPESLAIIAVTLGIWAGSHFFGVGEVVDVILGVVGVVTLGWSVFEGAGELYKFAKTALNATTDEDLETAGKHFARAITILGISTVQAVLLHGQVKAIRQRRTVAVHRWHSACCIPTA